MAENKKIQIEESLSKLSELSSEEITSLIEELTKQEIELSKRRKDIHRLLDLLKEKLIEELKEGIDEKIGDDVLAKAAKVLISSSRTIPVEVLAEEEEKDLVITEKDLNDLDLKQIEDIYQTLRREEAKASYRRRVVQGKIDILQNELLARLESSRSSHPEVSEDLIKRITNILSKKGF